MGLDKRKKEKQANVELKERMFMKQYIMSVVIMYFSFLKNFTFILYAEVTETGSMRPDTTMTLSWKVPNIQAAA